MICSIDGCTGQVHARGWCQKHYRRWKSHGSPDVIKARISRAERGCQVAECSRAHDAKGYCAVHYQRMVRTGDPEKINGPRSRSDDERWELYVRKTERCWLWTGALTTAGYGSFTERQHRQYAHRWAYEQLVGPVPDGLVLDHLCRVRNCVNPEHLEPITIGENVRRGREYGERCA